MFSNIHYYFQRKILPGLKIKKKSLVVDIGSGDKPFWRADIYVDDLSLGDVQRASESKTIHHIGKFVNANVIKLPFNDRVFDFSFCAHLLEHVEDPGKAIKEITRVSKAGYIEIPNGIIETIQPFVSHIWFVYENKSKLVFVRKSKKMHETLMVNGKNDISLISKSKNPFIRLYWKNKIDYEIIDNLKDVEKYYSPIKLSKKVSPKFINFHLILVKFIRKIFYSKKQIPQSIFKK